MATKQSLMADYLKSLPIGSTVTSKSLTRGVFEKAGTNVLSTTAATYLQALYTKGYVIFSHYRGRAKVYQTLSRLQTEPITNAAGRSSSVRWREDELNAIISHAKKLIQAGELGLFPAQSRYLRIARAGQQVLDKSRQRNLISCQLLNNEIRARIDELVDTLRREHLAEVDTQAPPEPKRTVTHEPEPVKQKGLRAEVTLHGLEELLETGEKSAILQKLEDIHLTLRELTGLLARSVGATNTAPLPNDRRSHYPNILIVGPLPGQQTVLDQAFAGQPINVTYDEGNGPAQQLKEKAKYKDAVYMLTKFSSHSVDKALHSVNPNVVRLNGSVTDIKRVIAHRHGLQLEEQ